MAQKNVAKARDMKEENINELFTSNPHLLGKEKEGSAKDRAQDKLQAAKRGISVADWEKTKADAAHDSPLNVDSQKLNTLDTDPTLNDRTAPNPKQAHLNQNKKLMHYARNDESYVQEARRGASGETGDPGDTNIIYQMRKSVLSRGQHEVEFADGSKHKISVNDANKMIDKFNSIRMPKEKQLFTIAAGKSLAGFKEVLLHGAPKEMGRKVSLGGRSFKEFYMGVGRTRTVSPYDRDEPPGTRNIGEASTGGVDPDENDNPNKPRKANPKLDLLLRLGLADGEELQKYRRALRTSKKQALQSPEMRKKLADLLDKLIDLTTGDAAIYSRARTKVITTKEAYSLLRKADMAGIDANIIAEVYVRGLNEHGGDSALAFDRVNSFIAGGMASLIDGDLAEAVKAPTGNLKDACWSGYTAVGMKMKNGRKVPNCVPKEEAMDEATKQQKAAGAALATQRGEYAGGKKGGAVNRMSLMKTKDLVKLARGKKTNEEVEQIDELSPATLSSYKAKAAGSEKAMTDKSSSLSVPAKDRNAAAIKANQRRQGMKLATKKLGEEVELEEAHMSEKDAERLAQKHVNAAKSAKKAGDLKGHDAHAKASNDIRDMILKHTDSPKGIPSGKMQRTAEKLFSESSELEEGIQTMSDARLKFHALKSVPHGSYTKKEIAAEHNCRHKTGGAEYRAVKPSLNEEEADQINEARPSQRHPLEDHPYHKKTSDDIHFEKQSKEMQTAINMHLRRDKTYQQAVAAAKVHVKEEVEQVDEISSALLHRAKQAAQKKAGWLMPGDKGKGDKAWNRVKKFRDAGVAKEKQEKSKVNEAFAEQMSTHKATSLTQRSKRTKSFHAWEPPAHTNEANRVADVKMIKVKLPDGRVVFRKEHTKAEIQQEAAHTHPTGKIPYGVMTDKELRADLKKKVKSASEAYTGSEPTSSNKDDPSNRFVGTDAIRKNYAAATPGQTQELNTASFAAAKPFVASARDDVDAGAARVQANQVDVAKKHFSEIKKALAGIRESRDLNESFSAGFELAPFARDYGIQVQSSFTHHPEVQEALDAQEDATNEAIYQGRNVPLNKPMKGDVKKSKVYVRDPSTGNIKKVNFGDKTLSIKKDQPGRKRSYCARSGGQGNLTKKTSANYWSRRAWDC